MTTLYGRLTVFGTPDFPEDNKISFRHNCSDLTEIKGHGSFGLGNWNDEIRSFIVEEGTWVFYENVNYGGEATQEFGPGRYRDVADYNIRPDWISSMKIIRE